VENLAGRLRDIGVEAWVYSIDRTLAEDAWQEIEDKIQRAELFIFVASRYSRDAKGQHRELQLALDRITRTGMALRMIPIVVDDVVFNDLPGELRRVNGLRLDAYTVKSTAHELATTFFPEFVDSEKHRQWKFPLPGQWLEICDLDQWIEEHFELGDQMYFRRISPLGLFECYSPKLSGLFWLAAHNLRPINVADDSGELERERVPRSYRYSASYDFERIGIEEMRRQGRLE
jgi:hypothetical protein